MKENHIIINKTARFYTLGELSERTKQAWIVLHGWGMNAKDFLASFEPLLNDETFFIAPEALNRFYLKGSGGQVGATWMTREDRLNEIKDYIHYLDDVYEFFDLGKFAHAHLTALGFSQGASTITRWANASEKKIDTLIVFAGEVAPELVPLAETSGLKRTKNIFIMGTGDEYFTPPLVKQMKETYREMNFTEIAFNGKHEINIEALKQALAS
jgi:predicted esterase